jgi:3-oxoacyl-(acyl-carrier-protein) synthase
MARTDDIIVTRSAVLSPAAGGVSGLWDAMMAGKTFFRLPDMPPSLADSSTPRWPYSQLEEGQRLWPEGSVWADCRKYANTAAQLAVQVTVAALEDGSHILEGRDASRAGVVIAAGNSGNDELETILPALAARYESDPRPLPTILYEAVPDYSYLRGIPVQIAQFVSMFSGFCGPSVAVNGEGSTGGLGALTLAARILQSGEADQVIVVAVAPQISASTMAALDLDEPFAVDSSPGRGPFDANRAGTIMGQGAAALVLERARSIPRGGSPPLAAIVASETCCSADRRHSLSTVLQMVLDRAGAAPGFWWAHGAASRAMDFDEVQAVSSVIGTVPVAASKGTIGNAFDASALIDVAMTIESFRRSQIPPIGLLRKPDPDIGSIDPVVLIPRSISSADTALVTGFTHGLAAAAAGAAIIRKACSRDG